MTRLRRSLPLPMSLPSTGQCVTRATWVLPARALFGEVRYAF